MPTPINIQSEMDRHKLQDNDRIQQLVEQQYNTEMTHGFALSFLAKNKGDAEGLTKLLFAKGFRLLTCDGPEQQPDTEWLVRVAVKHSLREITQEDFVCDLVTVASGVHACYDHWDFLNEEPAEQTQEHTGSPDVQP